MKNELLDAGKELDALIAQRVMGWQVAHYTKEGRQIGFSETYVNHYEAPDGIKRSDFAGDFSHWSPSENLADAFEVVRRIQNVYKLRFSLLGHEKGYWHAEFFGGEYGHRYGDVYAPTAPHAISNAALQVVGSYQPVSRKEAA